MGNINYGVLKHRALKMHLEGKTLIDISDALNLGRETCRHWIKDAGYTPLLTPRKRAKLPAIKGRLAHLK